MPMLCDVRPPANIYSFFENTAGKIVEITVGPNADGSSSRTVQVVPIGNDAYNRLYAKMRSVNHVLAWGHARVIENLMGQRHRMNPPCDRSRP